MSRRCIGFRIVFCILTTDNMVATGYMQVFKVCKVIGHQVTRMAFGGRGYCAILMIVEVK
jgi:hypothetical protein